MNTQHSNYYDDEGPLGEDNFSRENGEYGDWSSQQQQQYIQIPPPPSVWTQHVAPAKVRLPPFWTKDTHSWFTLAESTFNCSEVADPRLHFNLVLPELPEEVIEQIRGTLHAADPYRALKIQLLDLFTPKPLDQCQKIIHSSELGDRRPSQLMESMLALLPQGSLMGCCSRRTLSTSCPWTSATKWWRAASTSAPERWRL